MLPIHPSLRCSAALPAVFELPEPLAEAIAEVWIELEALEHPSLTGAFELFCAELPVVPHAWSKRHLALAEGATLTPAQALRLALLALGELGLAEQRSYAGRIEAQPWFRAYSLLADGARARERLAGFIRPLRWLIVDAVVDACELDSRVNGMQEATGWLWTCWRIERDAGLDIAPTLRRMWQLAERGFSGDGYDDGSYELSFADLADDVADDDPGFAGQLRLVHAFLDFASTPWAEFERAQLREALRVATGLELDVEGLRELCLPHLPKLPSMPIIGAGATFEGELPVREEDV